MAALSEPERGILEMGGLSVPVAASVCVVQCVFWVCDPKKYVCAPVCLCG